MLRAASQLEDLAMNPSDVKFLLLCCNNSFSSDGTPSFWTEKTEIGPDVAGLAIYGARNSSCFFRHFRRRGERRLHNGDRADRRTRAAARPPGDRDPGVMTSPTWGGALGGAGRGVLISLGRASLSQHPRVPLPTLVTTRASGAPAEVTVLQGSSFND